MKPSIRFSDITREIAQGEFDRYNRDKSVNLLLLGKIVAWCDQLPNRNEIRTLKKFIKREFSFTVFTHAYSCANLFKEIMKRKLRDVTEDDYDAIPRRRAIFMSSKFAGWTDKEFIRNIKLCLEKPSDGELGLRYPNLGYIYAMVSSASQDHTKLGETRSSPDLRARDISSHTGVKDKLITVWYEYVSDRLAAEGELKRRFVAQRESSRKEWFRIHPMEAIKALMDVSSKYRVVEEGEGKAKGFSPHY